MKTVIHLLALSLAPGLLAQHFDPRPEGALVRVAFDGPARMREAFAGTNMHDLLSSKGFGEAYAPVTKAIQDGIEAMKGQVPFDPQAAYDGVLRYAGRIELTVGVSLSDEAQPTAWAAMSLGGDGHTDLATLCKEMERLALDAGAPLAERNIGGHKWLAQDLDDAGFVTLPRMIGARAVMLGGTSDADAALAAFFPTQAPAAPKAETPISFTIDVGTALELAKTAVEAESAEGQNFASVMDAIGFGNLKELAFDIGRVKRFLDMTMTIGSSGPRQGFLAMVMPNGAKLPAVGSLVHQSPNWSVAPFDATQLLPMIDKVLALLPDARMDLAQVEATVLENVGVRLRDDILAHLGTSLLVATDDSSDEDAGELGAMTSMCIGMDLRDGAAFGRAIETVLERAGVLEMRKSEKYRDTDVHRVTVPGIGIKVHWAITDRLFLLGVGDGGRARLGGILDAAAAAARGEDPPGFTKAVRERLEVVAPGYGGMSAQKFGAMFFDAALAGLREAEGDLDIDIDAVTEIVDALRALFTKHDLGQAVGVTYYDAERCVGRTIW